MRRKLKGRANNVSVDNAGRIGITAELRGAVGIDKDVVVLGNTGYFEIWDAKRFDEQDDDIDLSLLFG
ncbi:MAG: division/cell wall cluster transcriptional repressor MraZ [Senegalimassilia faecalis]